MNPEENTDPYEGSADGLRQNAQVAEYEQSENSRLQVIQQQKAMQQKAPKPHVPWIRLWIMLLFAILIDIISFLINLLPIIGGVLQTIFLTPVVILIFWLWSLLTGVSLFRGARKYVTMVASMAGFIPVVNAIPEWTGEVIVLMIISSAEVYGGKMIKSLPVPRGIKNTMAKGLKKL